MIETSGLGGMQVKLLFVLISIFVALACNSKAGEFENGLEAIVRKDYTNAVTQFKLAAEKGNASAQSNLGAMYYNGQGVPQDYLQAVNWYRKAADQGNAFAQYNLGIMYDNGLGVPQDYLQAVNWYRKAADQGNASAQSNLGIMYYIGQGVPQDYILAHFWLNLAASQGREDDKKRRDAISSEMLPAQIAEAQKLAREWKPVTSNPKK